MPFSRKFLSMLYPLQEEAFPFPPAVPFIWYHHYRNDKNDTRQTLELLLITLVMTLGGK